MCDCTCGVGECVYVPLLLVAARRCASADCHCHVPLLAAGVQSRPRRAAARTVVAQLARVSVQARQAAVSSAATFGRGRSGERKRLFE